MDRVSVDCGIEHTAERNIPAHRKIEDPRRLAHIAELRGLVHEAAAHRWTRRSVKRRREMVRARGIVVCDFAHDGL